MRLTLRLAPPVAALLILSAFLVCPAPSAEPAKAKSPPAKDAAPPPTEPEGRLVREQTIYVPYNKLRTVFEQHGRGVFLPYEKFQELWQAAQKATAPAAEVKPPVAALITASENEATAGKDVVQVKARLKIDVLAEGWHEVPLRLADCAISQATLAGQPARILGGPEKGYTLLLEKKGKQPERIELEMEYAKAIVRAPGQNSVSFEAPQAAVSRWQVRIPESGVKVDVQPAVAVSQAAPPKAAAEAASTAKPRPAAPPQPAEETVVLAFVGAAPSVRIGWAPKAEGATGLEALASVQAQQQVEISQGVVHTRAQLTYAISRAQLAQLTVEVPADQKVVDVSDANVRQWTAQAAGGVQKIDIALFEPAKAKQEVAIVLEHFAAPEKAEVRGQEAVVRGQGSGVSNPSPATDHFLVSVPVVRALNVGRQAGAVVVTVDKGLRAEANRTAGLLQTDLPADADARQTFAYRYVSVPFELVLAVEKVQPRITADTLTEIYLEPERLALDMTTIFDIQRADVFRLELEVPAGCHIDSVAGRAVAGATAADVDSHHLEGARHTRLIVELAHKASGRVGLAVQLSNDLHEPALTSPTEKPADIPVALPRVPADGAGPSGSRAEGHLMLYAPESLQVKPKAQGARGVSYQEAVAAVSSQRGSRWPSLQPVQAYAHGQEAVELTLSAQRRKPQVVIGQLLVAHVEEGVTKYQATLFYNVQYSGIKSLRIDVPQAIADKPHLAGTPGLRDEGRIEPQPADVASGYVARRLTVESGELLGQGQIALVWEDEAGLGRLKVGQSVTLAVPRVVPRGVDRAWGQIVLAKAETIDIQETPDRQGLTPIDPQHDLMPGAAVPGAARAFEFHDDWSLGIVVTRYRLAEVKRTSIEQGVVRMVATRSGRIAVQALYRLRSAQQRLELTLPAGAAFDAGAARIDGRPVAPEKGDKDRYFVPLSSATPGQPLVLELRYTVPGDGRRLDLPDFATDPAVQAEPAAQRVYLCVYVPEEKALWHHGGPWTEEFHWQLRDDLSWEPVPKNDIGTLLSSVSPTGSPLDHKAAEFPTDGRLFVFSTLQPAAPPEGALHLVLLSQAWTSTAVLAGIVLLGLLLLPAGAGTRVLLIGLALVLMIGGGMFWPVAARQLVGWPLAAGLVVVAVVWLGQFLRRCCRQIIPATVMPAPAVAPVAPAAAPAAEPPPTAEPQPAPPAEPTAAPPVEQQGGPDHA